TYQVTDRGSPDNCGAVSGTCAAPKSTTATVSITADPVNDEPPATPTSGTPNKDASEAIDLGALVSDVETSATNLTYTIASAPANGTLPGAGGSKPYTPTADYNGADAFTYKVTDRGDPDNCGAPSPTCTDAKDSTTETVSITVDPVNDQPQAA